MTFQQLNYLLEVHRAGSITQAANQLLVSASSISIAITNIEKELGYPIFFRNQKGLELTPRGKQVIEHVNRICESYKQLSRIDHETYSTLRVGSLDYDPCTRAFSRFVAENQTRNDISLSLVSCNSSTAINRVANFELDIGIIASFQLRFLALQENLKRKKLNWEILGTVPCVITIGPGHRLYQNEQISTTDITDDLLIDHSNQIISGSNFLKGVVNIPSNRILTIDNPNTRFYLLSKGIGYTIGRMLSDDVINKYGLRCIPIQNINYQITRITNPMRRLSSEGERFLELLKEEVSHQKQNPCR